MKEQMQSQQSGQNQSSQETSSNPVFCSNGFLNVQAPPKTIQGILAMIADGQMQDAMDSAHQLADISRKHQCNSSIQWAGKLWTIANTFSEIQQIIVRETMDGVKEKAAHIGELARALMNSGEVAQSDVDRVLQSAGGYWELADKDKASKDTSSNSTGAASVAQNSETVEQYKMGTNRPGAHCGIATSLMLLQANGKGDMSDANQLVSEMYIYKKGTDVDKMADALRKRGLENAQSTRHGTWGPLMETLQKGQPVPFGVTHSTGEIVKMNSNPSKYFAHKRPGDRYDDDFPGSGHWVLVVGFEGTPESPTHFLYNDPHLGGQVRATKSELERMGVGNGNFFQITQ